MGDKYYLLRFEDNLGDEMDLESFVILTEEEHTKFMAAIGECEGFTLSVGTNEEIEYENNTEVRRAYEIQELTFSEYTMLKDLDLLEIGNYAANFYDHVVS